MPIRLHAGLCSFIVYSFSDNFSFNQVSHLSTNAETKEEESHNIIKNTEKPTGEKSKHEFQAETKMLLDIVARSLYSEKEVFVRELISNSSDALEKFRYLTLSGGESNLRNLDRKLEIHISTDKQNRTLTIQVESSYFVHNNFFLITYFRTQGSA